jgi:hypothetical protein
MNNKTLTLCLLLTGIWLAPPPSLSAKALPYSAENWSAPMSFILKVQSFEGWVGGREEKERDVIRRHHSSNETETHSYSNFLGPSFDNSSGVKEESPTSDPSRGRGLSGDPSVKDLSDRDMGGFAPPGSYTGSQRRP